MSKNNKPCPEFPHFGARYPDARCIDGYLWDLDSSEDDSDGNIFTSGGDDPCPFCNTEEYLEWAGVDETDDEAPKRETILAYIEKMKEKYG